MKVKKNKCWKNYQVEDVTYSLASNGGKVMNVNSKSVDELTSEEAKNELCIAMDVIERMSDLSERIAAEVSRYTYSK